MPAGYFNKNYKFDLQISGNAFNRILKIVIDKKLNHF